MSVLTEETILRRSKADSLDTVRHLNVWGCRIADISIVASLPNLEVLNLSCNEVTSLKALESCHKLTELYIRRNQLSDLEELKHLSHLQHLKILWLSDNPLSSETGYRTKVSQILPQVAKLDNISLHREGKKKNATLEAVLLLLGELDKEDLISVQKKLNHLLQ